MRTLARIPVLLLLAALATLLASPASAAQVGYKAIGAAIERARELDDAFGGVWLEGDGVVFAFTHRATDAEIAEVLGLVRPGTPVTTVRVDWSEAELDATHEAITDYMVANDVRFVTGVGTDPKRNAVVVGILPQWFDACQAGLVTRFGPVRIVVEPSGFDVGAEGNSETTAPAAASGSPEPSLPPGCLPLASPGPSALPSGAPPMVSPLPSGAPMPAASS